MRVTFVPKGVDDGQVVCDYVIGRISPAGKCGHYLPAKVFEVMVDAGVKFVQCPGCGCRVRMPKGKKGLDES